MRKKHVPEKNGPAAVPFSPGLRSAALEEPHSGVPERLSRLSGSNIKRGIVRLLVHTASLEFNVRTRETLPDWAAIIQIAEGLSLRPERPQSGGPVFSSMKGGFLLIRVSFHTCEDVNYYHLQASVPAGRQLIRNPAVELTMQLAARLFAIKEKPNFDDAAARNCADALRHWMPASPASGSDNPGA